MKNPRKTLGDRGFLTAQLPFNKEVLKSFNRVLREQVKTNAPQTRPLFNIQSKEITLRDALLEKTTRQSGSQILSLTNILSFGAGATAGGLPGAAVGIGLRQAIQSTPFLTGAGVTLAKLGLVGQRIAPILQKLAPAERTIILNLLTGTIDQETE